ncbi:MAG: hypothetical protein AB1487_05215 [Thermodesulfobacteriota bacterium]
MPNYKMVTAGLILTCEPLVKIVTPVETGVQRYFNLLEITGFRRLPRTPIRGSPE